MSTPAPRRRGQPLAALALVLAAWIGGRAIAWAPILAFVPPPLAEAEQRTLTAAATNSGDEASQAISQPTISSRSDPSVGAPTRPAAIQWPAPIETTRPSPVVIDVAPPPPALALTVGRTASAHQLRGMTAVPMPLALLSAPAPLPARTAATTQRWSGDAWLFLRGGGQPANAALAGPTYGASQVGAVLRYRLAPGSTHEPAAYLRAASALGTLRQREAAAGLAMRAIAALPVVAMAEARITDDGGNARVRPAVLLATQLAPFRIPGGLEGELYASAGYIAGPGATPFGDAQARLTRSVLSRGRLRLDVGAGAWAGGQRGAARVDVGPTAAMTVPVGSGAARVAADWRLRVAGDARPASGPALTISAGF